MKFIWDIDGTLLATEEEEGLLHGLVESREAHFHPYERQTSYALHPIRLKRIFEALIEQGHSIAFVTAGSMSKEAIRQFVFHQYGVHLPMSFEFYNDQQNKYEALKRLQGTSAPEEAVFIDNNPSHLYEAELLGLHWVYAATNEGDPPSLVEQYPRQVEKILGLRSIEDIIATDPLPTMIEEKNLWSTNMLTRRCALLKIFCETSQNTYLPELFMSSFPIENNVCLKSEYTEAAKQGWLCIYFLAICSECGWITNKDQLNDYISRYAQIKDTVLAWDALRKTPHLVPEKQKIIGDVGRAVYSRILTFLLDGKKHWEKFTFQRHASVMQTHYDCFGQENAYMTACLGFLFGVPVEWRRLQDLENRMNEQMLEGAVLE